MNIFETVKMRRLLNRRYKLKAELMTLENDNDTLFDWIVPPYDTSPELCIQIDNLKDQIRSINAQIDKLEKG